MKPTNAVKSPSSEPRYLVTKKFLTGERKGMTVTERTSLHFTVGRRYSGFSKNGSYIVTSIEPYKG